MLKEAIKAIKHGKVIICPTDTVYGLIADATDKKAVEKVFKIKKRKKENPLPIFVKDVRMAKKLAKIDKKQEEFLKSVWPGKITVVLKRNKIKGIYGLDKKTIALRIPKHKLVNNLLKKIKKPLIGTSANLSGKHSTVEIKKVLAQFKDKKYQPDLIINAGNLPKNKPSIVLDLRVFPPKILRR